MKIDVRGLADTRRAVGDLAKQIPFATARAINTTAFAVRAAEQQELRAKLDRPTPWSIGQVRVKQATKTSLTAVIGSPSGVKNIPGIFDRVMGPHVAGGNRMPKPVEQQMVRKGWIRANWRAIPTSSEQRDQYGNVALSDWNRLLSLNNGNYFVVDVDAQSHLPPGIYRRYGGIQHGYTGKRVEQLVAFKYNPDYRPIVDWTDVGIATVSATFTTAFDAALTDAINSAL